MNIYFARHGQTDWNILGKVQGTTDIPLNDTGIKQAEQLCEYFETHAISLEKVYTSRQTRAVQTAQIVSDRFGLAYEAIPGLEEMNMGAFEGHIWTEIESLYPEELKRWNSDKRYEKTPGGESYQLVLERVFRALENMIGRHDPSSDKNLLVISHGGVIMTLIAIKESIPFEEAHLKIAVPNATPLCFSTEDLRRIKEQL
ncbi:MAG: histidine phosphatase family protein [Lachnospiraceae bacterium]|nr:histidine phosphatase family protein [Lachnospiraceae bacterium]